MTRSTLLLRTFGWAAVGFLVTNGALLALGDAFEVGDYRTGVSFRWLEADVVGAFRHSPRLLLEPVPRPRAGSVWARDDPAPGVLLGAAMVTGRVGKRVHRRRRRPT